MSIFSGLISNVQSSETGISFSIEEIRFNMTNSKIEVDEAFIASEHFFDALNRVSEVCASIESYNGNLDEAVRSFVDANGDLSAALGIALEEDASESNGAQVQNSEKKKSLISRIWDSIVKFFKGIWHAICKLFSWIFHGFKSVDNKIEAAQKNYGSMSPEERKQFLENTKSNVSALLITRRFGALKVITGYFNSLPADLPSLMRMYYKDPYKLYNHAIAESLEYYGMAMACNGKRLEEVLSSHSTDFVNMVFKCENIAHIQSEEKTLAEHGWNDQTINQLFAFSQEASNAIDAWINKVDTMEKAAQISTDQMQKVYDELVQSTDGFLGKYFNRGGHRDLVNEGPQVFQKGVHTVVGIYRVIAVSLKSLWQDDNRILDAFRKSADQRKRGSAE